MTAIHDCATPRGKTAGLTADRCRSSVSAACASLDQVLQVLMNEANGHRALPGRAGHPLDRTVAHVADREHARQAGLAEELSRPVDGPVTRLADHLLSRRVVRRDLVDGDAVEDVLVTVVAISVDVVGVVASVSAASTAATAGGSGGSP
jgi:hypothetical protein